MKSKSLALFAAVSVVAVSSSSAAIIAINDYTLVPDGSQYGSNNANLPAAQESQNSNVQTLNGGTVVLPAAGVNTV